MAAVLGSDKLRPPHNPSMKGHGEDLCKLLECLLHPNSFGYFLEQHKVDPKAVLCCVKTWCKARLADPTKGELSCLPRPAKPCP